MPNALNLTGIALSVEQGRWKRLARSVAQNSLAPKAAEVDRDAIYPREGLKAIADAGLMALTIPKEQGGPGEGILTPQAVRMIGADTVHALNASAQGFALGGIVGQLLSGPQSAAGSALGALSGGFAGQLAGGAGSDVLQALGNWIASNATSLFANIGAAGGGGGGGAAAASGQVMQWIMAAIAQTGVAAGWAPGLALIIQHESGGNPSAINTTDINAQRGDPSVGLMQLILSNQAHYGGVTSDPVMQIVEGIRYIIDRYGDISRVPGVASVMAGGPYVPYDSGGWLLPGGRAINMSGKKELVLDPEQSAAVAASGGAGVHYHFHTVGELNPNMVRESQRVADWHDRTRST